LKFNFKDISSSHLPNVVFPVPGRAEIPIIFRFENLFYLQQDIHYKLLIDF